MAVEMRELTSNEQATLASVVDNMTKAQFETYLRIATKAAVNQMKRMGMNSVNGKGGDDYAIEGIVYIASRGQDFRYLSRRTKLLVLDGFKVERGRKGRVRPKTIGIHEKIEAKACEDPFFNLTIAEMPLRFRIICEALMEGKSKGEASELAGICPTKFKSIASIESWRLMQ